ncbi:MAG TPA: c-type cytochrome [Conexibacter sp.]|nr:c-type cytochrome [Conexibacter sp.]
MLATIVFLAFWVAVGLVLFFIALRGGPRGARATLQSQSRGSRRNAAVFFVVFYAAIGVAVPILILVGNHDRASARIGGTSIALTSQEQHGRQVFDRNCAVCHTLAAANANGKVGPNFDAIATSLTRGLVATTVQNGLDGPGGTMPAGIVQGDDVAAVAAFIVATAGK